MKTTDSISVQRNPNIICRSRLASVHGITGGAYKCDVFVNNQISYIFALPCRGPSSECVMAFLLYPLVGLDKIAKHLRLRGSNDTCINIGP